MEIPRTRRISYLTVPPAFDQAGRGSPLAVHLPRTLIIFSYYKEKQQQQQKTFTASNLIWNSLVKALLVLHIFQCQVVQKPVNINPGLKVNKSITFSCIKMFLTAYVLISLILL